MSALQHAWLGHYEISSTTCTGLTFARHSHDECVIGVNLVGEEKVWLDRREFGLEAAVLRVGEGFPGPGAAPQQTHAEILSVAVIAAEGRAALACYPSSTMPPSTRTS